jgi:hypothetical protein
MPPVPVQVASAFCILHSELLRSEPLNAQTH